MECYCKSMYAKIIWSSLLFTIQILYYHSNISRLYMPAIMMLITINLPHKCHSLCFIRTQHKRRIHELCVYVRKAEIRSRVPSIGFPFYFREKSGFVEIYWKKSGTKLGLLFWTFFFPFKAFSNKENKQRSHSNDPICNYLDHSFFSFLILL